MSFKTAVFIMYWDPYTGQLRQKKPTIKQEQWCIGIYNNKMAQSHTRITTPLITTFCDQPFKPVLISLWETIMLVFSQIKK